MNNTFVVCMGIGTVFVGLICIIILCKIIGAICMASEKKGTAKLDETAPVVANEPIQNRQEIIAAVSAVIAEELGKDISAIRILSFKKI